MRNASPGQRRGTAIIMALVCLVIVTALVGNMLVGAMRASRQIRVERDRRQCELLLEAGLDRAAGAIAADDDYTGDVWDVSAEDIGGSGAGQVTIQVTRERGASAKIDVLAEYPVGSPFSVRRSRTVHLQSTTPLPEE